MKIIPEDNLKNNIEPFEYEPFDHTENVNEPGNDSEIEPENELEDELEEGYTLSFNSVTLEGIKDILYELHEYFDEFEIEVVASPCLTQKYKYYGYGPSGYTYIMEMREVDMNMNVLDPDIENSMRYVLAARGRNYFFSDQRPGMVLKMRAKGRKTNYNIVILIQNILHKRFLYKIGLSSVFVIRGGHVLGGHFTEDLSKLTCHDIDCSSRIEIPIGAIVNDPVEIIKHDPVSNPVEIIKHDPVNDAIEIIKHDGLFYTKDRYMIRFYCQFELDRFVNDITPEKTEYVGYFNIADEVQLF